MRRPPVLCGTIPQHLVSYAVLSLFCFELSTFQRTQSSQIHCGRHCQLSTLFKCYFPPGFMCCRGINANGFSVNVTDGTIGNTNVLVFFYAFHIKQSSDIYIPDLLCEVEADINQIKYQRTCTTVRGIYWVRGIYCEAVVAFLFY